MRLTMPEKSERERRRLLERHFAVLGEVMMDMLWALSADAESVRKLMTVEGRLPGSCILLAPHFVGMDIGSLRLSLDLGERVNYYYKPMHNPFWNFVIASLRNRHGAVGFDTSSKYAFIKAARRVRDGDGVFAYCPDIDPRARKSTVYVPFMAQPAAATTVGLSRLARLMKVPVVPSVVCRTETGFVLHFLPPLTNFPSAEGEEADAIRMNEIVAEWVRKNPENYFWLHRRFKTAERSPYQE